MGDVHVCNEKKMSSSEVILHRGKGCCISTPIRFEVDDSLKPNFPDGAEERLSCSCICYISSDLICRLAMIMSSIAVFEIIKFENNLVKDTDKKSPREHWGQETCQIFSDNELLKLIFWYKNSTSKEKLTLFLFLLQ